MQAWPSQKDRDCVDGQPTCWTASAQVFLTLQRGDRERTGFTMVPWRGRSRGTRSGPGARSSGSGEATAARARCHGGAAGSGREASLAGDPGDALLSRRCRPGCSPAGRPHHRRGPCPAHRHWTRPISAPGLRRWPARDSSLTCSDAADRRDDVHARASRGGLLRALHDAPERRTAEGATGPGLRGLHGRRQRLRRGGLGQSPRVVSRTLVQETALYDDLASEVLDWERATSYVEKADSLAVTNCFCRHVATHLGTACDYPMETCMSLGRRLATSSGTATPGRSAGRRDASSSRPHASTASCTSRTTCSRS